MTNEQLTALEQLNELCLTGEEKQRMLGIFEEMAAQEERMNDFDTGDVEIMVHVMPLSNILREDAAAQPFTRESLLEGAPEHTEDSWQVPRLVK